MRSGDETVDDAELIHRFLAGDETAFELLMETYHGRILRLASHILADPPAAEDVAQEVFLRAYRGLARFRGEASLMTWLSRITVNLCVTVLHRRREAPALLAEAPGSSSPVDPTADLEARRRRAVVTGAIEALHATYRVAVILSTVEERSYREIADLLGIPIGTVKSRINAGKQLLKEKLLPLLRDRDR